MNQSDKYEISFSGLSTGIHEFDWTVEPTFFEEYDSEEITDSALKVEVSLNKNDRMMTLNFNISGRVKTLCDRCAEDLWLPVDADNELIARFANETDLSGDEVIFLDNSEYKLAIGQYIYEFTMLSLPAKRAHASGECPVDVDKYLNTDSEETKTEDPRWEALKNLKT